MKLLKTATLLSGLLLATQVCAKTVADVEVADSIKLGDQTLQLNGAGVRSKFFMDLYVGSLYTLSPTSQASAVIDAPIAVIRLNITSGLITSDKMHDAIVEGFEDATDDNLAPIQAEIDDFMALFSDEIVKGDQFTLEAKQGVGVTAYKNGQAQATIQGETFRQALLNIWLGQQPAQKSLKRDMLGE
ncbi:chalcone isomerase family protein [Shewanella sp. Isolate11]|uniref:chalcone isomerase family protein n=1 Tax=Shewanella sp. Isolate11 TaxID=2908530 RepID=UPI001EFEE40D|nr:chalcone isomerase family protein [Shewanella sp. Isolate11]MCG9697189.1 chalcone isomerase family protein [Shewanella sp. Isolate11]